MGGKSHPASLIELLHPAGFAETARVFGSACPEGPALCPRARTETRVPADLIVIAPSREEGKDAAWLRNTVHGADGLLAGDGIIYALGDRAWRASLLRELAKRDLVIDSVYLHHPGWPHAELLIPATFDAIAYAYSRLIHTDPARRKAALAALAAPGALAVARRLLPQTGIVARRRTGKPSLGWLPGGTGSGGRTIIQASWRGAAGAVLLHAFDGHPAPSAIAKLWLSEKGADACAREVEGLKLAAGSASNRGVRTPGLLVAGNLHGRPYLVEEVVAGERAAELVERDSSELLHLLPALAAWLLQWHRATARWRQITDEDVERHLLGPARALRQALAAGEACEARLEALGHRLAGKAMPFVATHGDLTMVNVLLDARGSIGIVDWETAAPSGLPLADFFYAAVDAVAASERYADRLAAWTACFEPGGPHSGLVGRLRDQLVAELSLEADQVDFSFQATWLRHALAERSEQSKAAPDEFLRLARAAAKMLLDEPEHREHAP
jgi:hypothetical protein